MRTELVCINCPMGCRITVEQDENGEITLISGNTCKRGETYARNEITSPVRTITTLVEVEGSTEPLSVKTAGNVPKKLIFECLEAIHAVKAVAPVRIGDIIVKDVCSTGVDVVATKNIG